ncbi:MAG: rhomboid family intramembrane serine protease [Flavobacteriaceae bacterium]|nr:rhomboid family intramembrane serine protease [Flavobacteriaceae bacterium]
MINGISVPLLVLIAANVLVSKKGFDDGNFFERYKFQIGPIRSGEYFRMFSSGFLHVDRMHLFFNMFTLYFFTDIVVQRLGTPNFFIVYVVSLLGGSLLSLAMHQKEYYYSAVGASGAVTGVLYAAVILYPEMKLQFLFLPFIKIPGYIFGIGYLLYSIYGMRQKLGNISHSAHFGGAIAGYATVLLMRPYLLYTNTFLVVALAVPIVLLWIMERNKK